MSRFHETKQAPEAPKSHLNWMGGQSFDLTDPVKVLRIAASSCFFGEPQYYVTDPADKRPSRGTVSPSMLTQDQRDGLRSTLDAIDPREWRSMTPAEAIESAVDKALDHDPERTLLEAVRLRQEEHIRTTPQVILVRAARHPKVRGTGLVRKYAPAIVSRADEPSVGLAYHIWRFGKDAPLPNALKKAWAARLSQLTEYQLAKYRMDGKTVKTLDVVNLVHPKRTDALDRLMKGTLTSSDQTWESIISVGGSTPGNWRKAIDVMGHMALLRNVRNLVQKGVDPSVFVEKLVEGAATGKQLPFRYYSAYVAVQDIAPAPVLDAIERCLRTSLDNVPRLTGKTISLCDNSGSAQVATTSSMGTMRVSTIANLTGVIAAMASDEGSLGVFGDDLKVFPVRKLSSIFDQLARAESLAKDIGQNTENGIWMFWRDAIASKAKWDNVFVFSDMQAGHGGLYGSDPSQYRDYAWERNRPHIDVAKLVQRYRAEVNPNVNVFLVQVAGYQDTIVPEFYRRTYVLGGWGEGVLRFAAEMAGAVATK